MSLNQYHRNILEQALKNPGREIRRVPRTTEMINEQIEIDTAFFDLVDIGYLAHKFEDIFYVRYTMMEWIEKDMKK